MTEYSNNFEGSYNPFEALAELLKKREGSCLRSDRVKS